MCKFQKRAMEGQTIFFCKIKLKSSNITSVSKQNLFEEFKTISKLGILAVTCYYDLGVWLIQPLNQLDH